MSALRAAAIDWGQESSFKLERGRLLAGRLLIGIRRRDLPGDSVLALAADLLKLPAAGAQILRPQLDRANAVFVGIEDRPGGAVFKLYLEFWDEVRGQVRRQVRLTATPAPMLLHLGVKWSDASAGRCEVARYECHPLIGARDVLRRMQALYPPGPPSAGCAVAQAIVRQSLDPDARAALLYEEVSEDGNPRRSFDVNLYKTGLRVGTVAARLQQAAAAFAITPAAIDAALAGCNGALLGHLSGGIGRNGGEFLSIYSEVRPLPAGD